jgi:hypothetical protein
MQREAPENVLGQVFGRAVCLVTVADSSMEAVVLLVERISGTEGAEEHFEVVYSVVEHGEGAVAGQASEGDSISFFGTGSSLYCILDQ